MTFRFFVQLLLNGQLIIKYTELPGDKYFFFSDVVKSHIVVQEWNPSLQSSVVRFFTDRRSCSVIFFW